LNGGVETLLVLDADVVLIAELVDEQFIELLAGCLLVGPSGLTVSLGVHRMLT